MQVKYLILGLLFLANRKVLSQTVAHLEHSAVVSHSGVGKTNDFIVHYIIGQSIAGTTQRQRFFLTQGFEQPFQIESSDALPSIILYPNPTDGQFMMDCEELVTTPFIVEVYDVHGILLMRREMQQQRVGLDLTGYADGTYWVRVIQNQDNKTFIKKIILQE